MLAAVALAVLVNSAPSAFADVLYSQPANLNGDAYSSQNDTNAYGNFATVYDNFSLASNATISNVTFTGEFFNPNSHGNITGFTIDFWADNVGQPGSLLASNAISGNASESFVNGYPTYNYSANIAAFSAVAATQYWISIVPNLGFPPQWGWATGSGGDGKSYQDFFGSRSKLQTDLAFTLNSKVPDSGVTAALLGAAFAGLVAFRRRFVC